jgi:hypothetical protein
VQYAGGRFPITSRVDRVDVWEKYMLDLFKELYGTPIKWDKQDDVFRNLHRITGRIVMGLFIPVLILSTLGLLVAFIINPTGFIESPNSPQNCVTIESSDGSAVDSCDFLVP